MIKRGDKSGQFYLIASLAIITLIMGLFLIGNSSKSQELPRVKEVAEELEIEGGKILDRGATTGNYNWDEFAGNFSKYAEDVDIVYITGSETSPEIFKYQDGIKNNSINNNLNLGILTVIYEGAEYQFNMRKGQNFYYIVSQYINKEKYVARN